jgi:hypothetical protein
LPTTTRQQESDGNAGGEGARKFHEPASTATFRSALCEGRRLDRFIAFGGSVSSLAAILETKQRTGFSGQRLTNVPDRRDRLPFDG